MARPSFVQIGAKKYPVIYLMTQMDELEEAFNVPLTGIFTMLEGGLKSSYLRTIVRVGLQGGADAMNSGETFTDKDVDELLQGKVLKAGPEFIKILSKDLGSEIPDEEKELEPKNPKARK